MSSSAVSPLRENSTRTPRGAGGSPTHLLRPVEDHGDLGPGLRGDTAQRRRSAGCAAVPGTSPEAALGDVVAVDDQVRLGQGQQLVQPGRVVGSSARGRPGRRRRAVGEGVGHEVGGQLRRRVEGQLAAQPDGGLPDRLQQQPQPGVVDRRASLARPCRRWRRLGVGQLGPQPAQLGVGSAAVRAARPFSVASSSVACVPGPGSPAALGRRGPPRAAARSWRAWPARRGASRPRPGPRRGRVGPGRPLLGSRSRRCGGAVRLGAYRRRPARSGPASRRAGQVGQCGDLDRVGGGRGAPSTTAAPRSPASSITAGRPAGGKAGRR